MWFCDSDRNIKFWFSRNQENIQFCEFVCLECCSKTVQCDISNTQVGTNIKQFLNYSYFNSVYPLQATRIALILEGVLNKSENKLDWKCSFHLLSFVCSSLSHFPFFEDSCEWGMRVASCDCDPTSRHGQSQASPAQNSLLCLLTGTPHWARASCNTHLWLLSSSIAHQLPHSHTQFSCPLKVWRKRRQW